MGYGRHISWARAVWFVLTVIMVQAVGASNSNAAKAHEDIKSSKGKSALNGSTTPVPIPLKALNLQTCYELAVLRSETLGMKEEDIRVAEARFWQAVAAVVPNVKFRGSQSYFNQGSGGFGGASSGGMGGSFSPGSERRDASLNVKVPIFAGFKDLHAARAFRADSEAKKHTRTWAWQQLYLSVAESYYDVAGYTRDEMLLADTVKLMEVQTAEMERRTKLGKSRDSELLATQTELASIRVNLEQTRGLKGASLELLGFLTGLSADQIVLEPVSEDFPSARSMDAYLNGTRERADLRAAEKTAESDRAAESAAKGEFWPVISAEGNYQLHNDPYVGQDWNAFISVELPLFDGGLVLAKVEERKARARSSQLDFARLQRESVRDTRTAWIRFNSSVAEARRLVEAEARSRANVEAQSSDYQLGIVNQLDVLQARRQWNDIRRQLVLIHGQVRLNLIKLHIAAGEEFSVKADPSSQVKGGRP